MTDQCKAEVQGIAGLMAELRQLPQVVQQRLMRGAMGTGARVIKDEAVRFAPEWTGSVSQGHPPPGTLKRAIYTVRLVDKCTATLEAWKVGVRSGKNKTARRGASVVSLDAYYASWVEYGHFARVGKGTSKDAKKAAQALGVAAWVPAHPFMRPAFETKKGEAVRAMQAYLDDNLHTVAATMRYLKVAA
jgi:HK97 gp10 family phage protein